MQYCRHIIDTPFSFFYLPAPVDEMDPTPFAFCFMCMLLHTECGVAITEYPRVVALQTQ